MNQKNGTAEPLFEYHKTDAEEVFLRTRRMHDAWRGRRFHLGRKPDPAKFLELRELCDQQDPDKELTQQEQFELNKKAVALVEAGIGEPQEDKEDVVLMLGAAIQLGEIAACNAGRLHELEPMPGGNAASEYAQFIRVAAIRTGQLATRLFSEEGYDLPDAEAKFESIMIPGWQVEASGSWDSLAMYTSMLAGDMWEWHDYYENQQPGKRQPVAPTELFKNRWGGELKFDITKQLPDPLETYSGLYTRVFQSHYSLDVKEFVKMLWDAVEMALHVGCRAEHYLSIDTPEMREEFAPVLEHYSDLARTAFLRIKEIVNIMFWYLGYDEGWKIGPSRWHGMTHDIELDYDMTADERGEKMLGHASGFMSLLHSLQTDITRWDAWAIFNWAKSLPDNKEGQDKLAEVDPSGKSAIWEEN